MINHRVDFAASMVDGRTVGEVAAESVSAKEIRELWTYVQGRLARLKNDAAFTPKAEPPDLAISGLSPTNASEPADPRDVDEPKVMSVPTPPPQPESNTGVERRSGVERRRVFGEAPKGFDNRRVHRRARRLSRATTRPFHLNRANRTMPTSCGASQFRSRRKNLRGSASQRSRRTPTATTSCAARSTIIFASCRRSSRILAPAWKAVLLLRHGTWKSSRGRFPLPTLCVPKTWIRQY